MKHFLNIKSGFGLIEVLVAIGLASLVGLGIASMMQNMILGQKEIEQKTNIMMLHSEIFRAVSVGPGCFNTFTQLPPLIWPQIRLLQR